MTIHPPKSTTPEHRAELGLGAPGKSTPRVPPGYKQTEVGVIPEDWDAATLSQVVDRLDSGVSVNSVESADDRFGHNKAVLKTSCVGSGKFYPDEKKWIVPRDLSRAKCHPARDTIIVSRMNTIALVAECGYVAEDYPNLFLPDRLWMTRHGTKSEVCVRWLAFLISSPTYNKALKESASGTSGSMKNLSKPSFLSTSIPLPPTLNEQEAIATALRDADALIDSLEQLIAKKRLLKQGAMQDLLTGKKRLPGFEGEWEVKRLGDMAELYQSETIGGTEFSSSGYLVYGANGVIGRYHRYNHEKPQITISCRGNCGTVNRTEPFSWITGNAMVVNLEKNQRVDHDFAFHQLREQDYSEIVTGSGQPQIVRGPLAAFEISLPATKAEQTAIAAILSDMDAGIAALDAKLAKARQVKQGMMQELLTGKTRLV